MKVADFTDISDVARLLLHVLVSPCLPWRAETRLVASIGALAYPLLGDMRRKIAHGLEEGLGEERPAAEIRPLVKATILHRWVQRELVWLWKLSGSARRREAACGRVRMHGLEHVRAGLRHGKGVIVLESHLGKRVLARSALQAAGFNLCQVHAATHGGALTWLGQRVLRRLHRRLESRLGLAIVDIRAGSLVYLRKLTRWLAQNDVVCLPGVGRLGYKFVAVDFLGAKEYFPTGTASLARMSGAPLIPLFTFESADGTDHVVLEPPITVAPDGEDDVALIQCVTQYARLLERYVRRYPAQWLWWHGPMATLDQLAGRVIETTQAAPEGR